MDASALERIGDEINALRPQSVILLVPHKCVIRSYAS